MMLTAQSMEIKVLQAQTSVHDVLAFQCLQDVHDLAAYCEEVNVHVLGLGCQPSVQAHLILFNRQEHEAVVQLQLAMVHASNVTSPRQSLHHVEIVCYENAGAVAINHSALGCALDERSRIVAVRAMHESVEAVASGHMHFGANHGWDKRHRVRTFAQSDGHLTAAVGC